MPGRKVPEAERREQLLAACFAVARRDGLDAVTARSVAVEAGVSPGLVFFHYGSKDALVAEMMRGLLAGALDVDAERTGDRTWASRPPRERLRELVRTELEGIPEQREPVELLLAGWFVGRELRGIISEALDRYRAAFVPVCAEATGGDGEALAAVVVALVQGAAFTSVRDPRGFDERAVEAALALLPG